MTLDSRKTAVLVTLLVAALVILLLMLCHMSFRPADMTVSHQPVAAMAELPEYVEFLEGSGGEADDAPAEAYTPVETRHASQPAPGYTPTVQEVAQERARERADRDIANAFAGNADNNTTARGDTPGDSGNPGGTESSVAGNGSGTVGGGWIMPHYDKIPSHDTGSIRLRATIGADGAVVRVVQIGGDAPASANSALVAACMAEVRSKRYTRPDTPAPEQATAFITYIFR